MTSPSNNGVPAEAIPDWLTAASEAMERRSANLEKKVIHVTELLNPAHQVRLKDAYQWVDDTEAESRIPAMLGIGFHEYLASLEYGPHDSCEEQSIDYHFDDWLIKGTPDWWSQSQSLLRDYKTTSMWSHVFGKREWEQQVNLYRWMLAESGHPLDRLEVHAVFTDWKKREVQRNFDLPRKRYQIYQFRPWPIGDVENFVSTRLRALEAPSKECSSAERWERDEHWAVMKTGRKTALKRCDSLPEAQEYRDGIVAQNADFYIEHRPGTPARCLDWCPVRSVCDFGKNLS